MPDAIGWNSVQNSGGPAQEVTAARHRVADKIVLGDSCAHAAGYDRRDGEAHVPILDNYIGGRWMPSTSGRVFENRNPANRDDLIGLFPDSTVEDATAAIEAARARSKLAADPGAQTRRDSVPRRAADRRQQGNRSRAT